MLLQDCISWWNEPSSTTLIPPIEGEESGQIVIYRRASRALWGLYKPRGERKGASLVNKWRSCVLQGTPLPKGLHQPGKGKENQKNYNHTITSYATNFVSLYNLEILYKYTIPPTHIVCITYFRDAQMHRLYSNWPYTTAKINKVCSKIMFKIIETIHRKNWTSMVAWTTDEICCKLFIFCIQSLPKTNWTKTSQELFIVNVYCVYCEVTVTVESVWLKFSSCHFH